MFMKFIILVTALAKINLLLIYNYKEVFSSCNIFEIQILIISLAYVNKILENCLRL